MTWLFSLLTGLPGVLNGLLTYLNKKQDNALEQFKIGSNNGRDVSIEVVKAELSRVNAIKEVSVAGMQHPLWWVAWAAFVFPVAVYEGCIFWVSTFPGLGWTVKEVPEAQNAFAQTVILSMFGYGAASTLVSTIASKWGGKA